MFSHPRSTEHRGQDDLLTAGLGLSGLQDMAAPVFADLHHPTAQELRRRAVWNNWRGIADLAQGGGYGTLYGSVANVPGREFSAFATLPGAKQIFRFADRDLVGHETERPLGDGGAMPEALLQPVLINGARVGPLPDAAAARDRAQDSLRRLPAAVRSLYDEEYAYRVDFSAELWRLYEDVAREIDGEL